MTKTTLFLAGALALVVGVASIAPDADARRVGGVRRAHVGHVHVHPNGVARRTVRRAGRWVNGVWIVNGVAASVAIGSTNCSYYWRRWKETGSAYWHDRYYENCR
jgi:hypothetical protein